jgi:hypothetical protein
VSGRVSLDHRAWTRDPDTWVALTPGVFHYPPRFWRNSPRSAALESYDWENTDPRFELILRRRLGIERSMLRSSRSA